jgi:hypothetical protein
MPVPQMSAFLVEHFGMVGDAAVRDTEEDPIDLRLMTFAVQPITHLITQASQDAGGNALGLSPSSGDRV